MRKGPGSFGEETDRKLLDWLSLVLSDLPEGVTAIEQTLAGNPGRISRAYRDLLSGYALNPKEVVKPTLELPQSDHQGLVVTREIAFLSFCAHHFLPFFGTVDVVYEPGSLIVGLGKMPRLVACRSRRFQLQELLVKELAQDMMAHAKAKGVYIRSRAKHICLCYRGPERLIAENSTTYSLGSLTTPQANAEIHSLLSEPRG